METLYEHLVEGFQNINIDDVPEQRRIGLELKFPLVNHDGTAASYEKVCRLWQYLESKGWQFLKDGMTNRIIGAKKPGPQNDTIAGCETGFCKIEFSMAHVANLFELEKLIDDLKMELRPFCEKHHVHLLGYGIQPVTPPTRKLLMKKSRTSPWGQVFGSNRYVSESDGDDFHLFTINAASHVHISVSLEEAVTAVNVLNGFAGAQIGLTANSNIWQGRIDPCYKCVAEKFWDWWIPDGKRVGMPPRPFDDLKDYCKLISSLRPLYVTRAGKPIVLNKYKTFSEFIRKGRAVGIDPDGKEVSFVPDKNDIDMHSTCYWYNSRISRYCTVENRANDQQPPGELLAVSALTLGLLSALEQAEEVLQRYQWAHLLKARQAACEHGVKGSISKLELAELTKEMLEVAKTGLQRRGLGELIYLEPLFGRLQRKRCPADQAAQIFREGGIDSLVDARQF